MNNIKPFHPYVKDPNNGAVYPNQEMFIHPGFIGCYNLSGTTDLDELTEREQLAIFPGGIPSRIAEANRALVGRVENKVKNREGLIGMEVQVVTENLERLYAEGTIKRDYLLQLAGGVPQETFVVLQNQVSSVLNDNAARNQADPMATTLATEDATEGTEEVAEGTEDVAEGIEGAEGSEGEATPEAKAPAKKGKGKAKDAATAAESLAGEFSL